MSATEELLPCPFCGGVADITYSKGFGFEQPPDTTMAMIGCAACGFASNYKATPRAITAWNRRAALTAPAGVVKGLNRDDLGRRVREAWVKWALTQPNPKPSWLVPYDELSEPDKEADRQIGEALTHPQPAQHDADGEAVEVRELAERLETWHVGRHPLHRGYAVQQMCDEAATALRRMAEERDDLAETSAKYRIVCGDRDAWKGRAGAAESLLAIIQEEVGKENAPLGRSDGLALRNIRAALSLGGHSNGQ